jgi:hypothetical protein
MADDTQQESLLERVRNRTLGDIRIHDSEQAGTLARRLGARAFTVGRDIYVRPELMSEGSKEGEALLAHEVTHVLEQSGVSEPDMTLLRPRLARGGYAPSASASSSTPVQRTPEEGASSSVPSSTPASQTSSEARAERVETNSRGGGQSSAPPSDQKSADAPTPPDAEEVADRVYRMMVDEIRLDGERSAHLW